MSTSDTMDYREVIRDLHVGLSDPQGVWDGVLDEDRQPIPWVERGETDFERRAFTRGYKAVRALWDGHRSYATTRAAFAGVRAALAYLDSSAKGG